MSVAFGMGGGLLQKINRDTLNFATKLCYVSNDGTGKPINVMKDPKTDPSKRSLPGNLSVVRNSESASALPEVVPHNSDFGATDLLKLAYDGTESATIKGIQPEFQTSREGGPVFSAIKANVTSNWAAVILAANTTIKDAVSTDLKAVQATAVTDKAAKQSIGTGEHVKLSLVDYSKIAIKLLPKLPQFPLPPNASREFDEGFGFGSGGGKSSRTRRR